MLFLPVALLILAFTPFAVFALKTGGRRWLWATCGLTLLVIELLAVVVSTVYSVKSPLRVLLYFLLFFGPLVVFTTIALSVANGLIRGTAGQMALGYAVSVVGLAFGLIVVVYGFGG